MHLEASELINLSDPRRRRSLSELRGQRVRAVAGIGHPAAFFAQLEAAGLIVDPWPYPDHHHYRRAEMARWQGLPVIMTEKDAVKCRPLAAPDWWFLPVTAVLDPACERHILDLLCKLLSKDRSHDP